MIDPRPERPGAVLLGVQLPDVSDEDFASSLAELGRLAKTLGLDVVGRVTQRRGRLATGAVVGEGKLKDLARFTGGTGVVPTGPPQPRRKERGTPVESRDDDGEGEEVAASPDAVPPAARASVVLIDHDVTPSQARNLERATGAEVLDRTAVILAIFQRHARSREARLQVEIARLNYMAPRLRESGAGKDRQGGGIGGRGAGESSIELDRRKLRDRVAELRAELQSIERDSSTRRKRREQQNTVALVGYTNAGKSSWMRALTGSGVLVQDKLFATLDTTVRALQPESVPRILISDTVGFIKKLPHDLVASFRSTLDEARDADLLVQLVDASDAAFPAQLEVTREVLREIEATDAPRVLVLNKIDKVDAATRERLAIEWPDAVLLSVKDPADVATMRQRIVAFFERDMVEEDLVVPYAKQRVVGEAHSSCRVVEESYDEHGTRLRVRARPEVIAKLRAGL
ncbi:MAG: GTP-binding protein related to HflX [Deltaproteobacteria bacterium]|nr:GTP-binding protein related to HflX [Deltaproteobacteria bacterium]